jgi:ankyrin repeat protein
MLQAVQKGDFAAVSQLLDQGAHINAKSDGATALKLAVSNGKTEAAALAARERRSVNRANRIGKATWQAGA